MESLLVILFILSIFFAIGRALVLWYFKLDKIEKHLKDIALCLKTANGTSMGSETEPPREGFWKGIKQSFHPGTDSR